MSMVNFAPARLLDIRLCLGSDTAVNGQRGFARKVSSLCVLYVSVVNDCLGKTTTEAQRGHREEVQ
jgi:hypothetical protein